MIDKKVKKSLEQLRDEAWERGYKAGYVDALAHHKKGKTHETNN